MNISRDNHLMLIQLILTITLLVISASAFAYNSPGESLAACFETDRRYHDPTITPINRGPGHCVETPPNWNRCEDGPNVATGQYYIFVRISDGYGLSRFVVNCPEYTPEYTLIPPPEPPSCDKEGNPCNPATGSKTQLENDYQSSNPSGISLNRYYHSFSDQLSHQYTGQKWRHQYDAALFTYSPSINHHYKTDTSGTNPKTFTSSVYTTKVDACTLGFEEIRYVVWGGKLATATASYAGGNICTISGGGGAGGLAGSKGAIFRISSGGGSDVADMPDARILVRPDGGEYYFGSINGFNLELYNPEVSLVADGSDWVFTDTDDTRERYNVLGQLMSITSREGRVTTLQYNLSKIEGGDNYKGTLDKVTDADGRNLLFTYVDNNGEPRLSKIATPDGNISYGYNTVGNLSTVTYPDGHSKTYHYEDTRFPHHLTGITDENGDRFATWAYDAAGKAILSEHAGGAERVTLAYNADGTTLVTGALGDVRTYDFDIAQGRLKVKEITGDRCTTCGSGDKKSRSYDANGFAASYTDWNGNHTLLVYNTRGLEDFRTEAKDSPQERLIQTQWHPDYRLPTQISKPGQVTDLGYQDGRLVSRTVTDTQSNAQRITTYSYFTTGVKLGLLQSIDGPRTDVNDITTFDYTANGDLSTVTNALNQTTTLSNHDASGRPQTITDANGQVTQLGYSPRGWLTSLNRSGQITVFDYDHVGQIKKLTLATGAYAEYIYDPAHRLTDITDNLGNSVHYTLDAMGNRKKTELKDPSGSLTSLLEQEFNKLSQLQLSIGGEGQITRYDYDFNGNQSAITDPRNTGNDRAAAKLINPLQTDNTSHSVYDALNRLATVNQLQTAGNSNDDVTATSTYNALDQLTKVVDPNGLETTYVYNALGDLLTMTSPDTGTTSYTNDTAGNRLSQTDARGITTTYTYDALNRLKSTSYPDINLNITYTYDENNTGQNGIGRLTTMTDASGTTQYRYDNRANLSSVTTTRGVMTLTTGYSYNGADQVSQIRYPSGRAVNYGYDAANRISGVTTTDTQGNTQSLLTNINYQPFGPMSGMTYGNNLTNSQSYDLDYRQTSLDTNAILQRGYGFDDASNIIDITNTLNTTNDQTFIYDGLSRLEDAQGSYGSIGYQYDKTSNRTQRTRNNTTDTYQYLNNSHHLLDINGSQQYSYDANGNTTNLPNPLISTNLVYGDHNRLSGVNGASYLYNGQGQRVRKQTADTFGRASVTTTLIYPADEITNNARLIPGMQFQILPGTICGSTIVPAMSLNNGTPLNKLVVQQELVFALLLTQLY
jgi:YD repeat-containing protein